MNSKCGHLKLNGGSISWKVLHYAITYKNTNTQECVFQEVRVRYVGFGSDEDEWVNVKNAVRRRSLPLEHSECGKVKVGDLVLCFQERNDQARYYDAHVVEIQRKLHDIRGCRCLFLIRYDHDNTEESVRLKRLCCQPTD